MIDLIQSLLCPSGFQLDYTELNAPARHLWLYASSQIRTGICPDCQIPTRRIHSHYERTVADLPVSDHRVTLRLRVRKFVCCERRCSRGIFAERLPCIKPWARRTQRLTDRQAALGIAAGGLPGERLSPSLAMPLSHDTLLRLIRRLSIPASASVQKVGIDDWAQCKRKSYGTIVIDLERHRPIALLKDREADTVSKWLKQHPDIELITRDRFKAYAEGASEGAPQAIQVADRFHLLRNLAEALRKVFDKHSKRIGDVGQPNEQMSADEVPQPVKTLPANEQSQQRRARRLARYEQVWALHRQGVSQRGIVRQLHLNRKTVAHWLRTPVFPERKARRKAVTLLDDYKSYLIQRWQSGCHNAMQLFHDIKHQGFHGSYSSVRMFLQSFRDTTQQHPSRSSTVAAVQPPTLTPSSAVWLVLIRSERQDADDQRQINQLSDAHNELKEAIALAQRFAEMVRHREGRKLDTWLTQAKASAVGPLARFAKSLETDYHAVKAALSLPWSNGPVEGHINKLKMLKRSMFGRAKFDLLEKRLLFSF